MVWQPTSAKRLTQQKYPSQGVANCNSPEAAKGSVDYIMVLAIAKVLPCRRDPIPKIYSLHIKGSCIEFVVPCNQSLQTGESLLVKLVAVFNMSTAGKFSKWLSPWFPVRNDLSSSFIDFTFINFYWSVNVFGIIHLKFFCISKFVIF